MMWMLCAPHLVSLWVVLLVLVLVSGAYAVACQLPAATDHLTPLAIYHPERSVITT